MPEFQEGFRAYEKYGARRDDPYDGVQGQAWDRGGLAAIEYKRAIKHLADHPDDVEKAGPRWLADLLKGGR
jgi:hypothetical protein